MTDADAEQPDAEEEVEQQAAEQADGDQPNMDTGDFADLDAIAEEVEAETAPDSESSTTDEESEEVEESTTDEDGETATVSGETWGDMYVGTLTTVSNALIEEHGKPGAEEVDEDLARKLDLDEHMNRWLEEQNGTADMDPAQGVMFGTTMFLVAVIGTKTDIPAQLLEEADF